MAILIYTSESTASFMKRWIFYPYYRAYEIVYSSFLKFDEIFDFYRLLSEVGCWG